jgi:polysaccharide chain length determinant protein (PEP-CTERM system associated)
MHAMEPANAQHRSPIIAQVPVLREELRRRPVLLASIFAAIALTALLLGSLIPKKFSSSTTILVEESNIIQPLMEGRAVSTGVADRAGISREVAFSRRVMQEILKVGGWMASNPTPLQQDKLIEKIVARTDISNPRANLIRIGYTDPDPERAFLVTRRFAEMVIEESLATKERESRAAYEFIDQQVRQYHAKLTDAEGKLERYRNTNPDARPGVEADVNARIGELRRQVETAKIELIDLRSEEAALQAQLSGESEISAVNTIASSYRARLIELQGERDRLMLQFTDQHPDVVRTQHQIRDLEEALRRETDRRESGAGQPGTINASSEFNPLYGELKSKLAQAQRRTAATASRIATTEGMLANELSRSSGIASSESALAELTRDYEVNRDLYQDLLKRRENARVSMNLDAERRGLSFRIQEPAALPLRPAGLRLLYVAIAGLALAVMVPLLLLFGLVKFDPRVRAPAQIEKLAGLPLLGAIPRYPTRAARARSFRRLALASSVFMTVPVVYGATLALRWLQIQ